MIDTQAIVWAVTGNPRLSRAARDALTNGGEDIFVSAVTADATMRRYPVRSIW